MRNGDTYTEAHHLDHLANGGLDVSRNMIIVCANHHRMFHFGDAEIIEHTVDTLVVRLLDEVYTVSLTFERPTLFG
jgi:predicted HNH restriction endonuclease